MKYLMAFLFATIPALAAWALLQFVMGPFAVLVGFAVWAHGMEVCLDGIDS